MSLAVNTLPGLVAGTWAIDPAHSEVAFTVRHLMVSKVRGTFARFQGAVTVAEDVLASSVEATVETASFDTRDAGRDNHVRSRDFLEVETYPELAFRSTGIRQAGDDFVVTGDLTLKGVTKSVELALEFGGVSVSPMGTRAGFSAETQIDRSEFGVDIQMPLDGGGLVVGEKVTIHLEIEAVLQEG